AGLRRLRSGRARRRLARLPAVVAGAAGARGPARRRAYPGVAARPSRGRRLDFAPPVSDFAAEGFPLAGGRLDYADNRPVAALVYRRDRHIIDLFVWPAAGEAAPATAERHGYNLVHWRAGGMEFWAVSDVEAAQLAEFARLWQAPAPP